MAASPAVKERLRKMRQKYHLGEYKKSRSSAPRRKRRSVTVARKTRKRRGRSSGSSGGNIQLMDVGLHAGYGYVRKDVIGFIPAQVTAMLPAQVSAGAAVGVGAYFVNKYVGGGIAKQATKAICLSEATIAGMDFRG